MRKKLLSIIMVCCMILGTAAVQISASDKTVDKDIIISNTNRIVSAIKASNDKDSDGNPLLKYKTSNGGFATVSIKNNQLYFFYNLETADNDTYVEMYADIPYSERMKATVDVYDEASSSETENDILGAEALVDPSEFDWDYSDSVKFTINPDSKKAQKTCNIVLGDAMELWNAMLFDKANMNICHLGFSNLCAHGWNNTEFIRPTKDADGFIVNVCQACAKIDSRVLPSDNWSATGKTVTLKAKNLKKKAATVSSAKALRCSSTEYRWLSYKKLSGNSKIAVNSKTGTLTVKKGLKKGTYKVKIKVNTVANDYYDASSKTATVTIKVK